MNGNWDKAKFAECIEKFGLYKPATRVVNYLEEYLDTFINPAGKNVLDVGGGRGIHSLWCIARGANSVLCLEPFVDDAVINAFLSAAKLFESTRKVSSVKKKIQDFESPHGYYDLIMLHNSVNHIDDAKCMVLHKDSGAREEYIKIFKKLALMTTRGGEIAIMDCARKNFFPMLGMKNPFWRTIGWEKHQSPYLWAELLREAGFSEPQIRWKHPSGTKWSLPLRRLFANRVGAYFYVSHFALKMKLL